MDIRELMREYGGFAVLAAAVAALALITVPGVEIVGGFLGLVALIVLLAMLLRD